ncbi:hypothetical protein NIES37_00770 [Tolypothrix tenuis PCC 7101]|uniref:Uncharacterized protein n=1 Tax=Tolypothrix tenuis PCC 7101 TaxID=231146 RepID=A0A1Z4MRP5_9CYAN|nr:hypothetical protein [Aulosira sp. FACHB-113]BAY96150.1 hypothetical protein NIES37_00770 [Tolypothrix tenuis PCC 7101]BAZ73343.1 hypothetical protein NIES50_19070 [Aulosira laxa NIES-50]
MVIKLTKLLSILANIFIIILLLPGIATALPGKIHAQSTLVIAQAPNSYSDSDLTPLQKQRLQAIRQRRNKEIYAVLNSSQRAKLAQELHHGTDFNQALDKLNLKPEQKEMIQAILHFTNLKMKFKKNW